MGGWYWVAGGSTRVDVSALLAACGHVDAGVEGLRGAWGGLLETSLGWNLGWEFSWSELLSTGVGAELAEVTQRASRVGWQAREALERLIPSVAEHGRWLEQAAAIYALAEEGALGLSRVCGERAGLGCSPSYAGGWAGVPGLIGALPGYVSEFKRSQIGQKGTGLEAQARLSSLVGGTEEFPVAAAKVARWWAGLGSLSAGRDLGTAVMSASGAVLWTGDLTMGSDAVKAAVTRLNAAPARASETVKTPASASELLQRISESGGGGHTGEVQVIRHDLSGGGVSWTVVVKGTQEWGLGGNNPQDMESNLQTVASVPSAQKQAVEKAMEMAGIGAGEPVELVGHSQGGAVALAVAATPAVVSKFNVVSVLTAGSPTGGIVMPQSNSGDREKTRVLNLENLSDLVPSLDGAPSPSSSATVYFDDSDLQVPGGATAHSLETYVAAAKGVEVDVQNPMSEEVAKWNQSRRTALGLDAVVSSEASYYRTTRVRSQ